MVCNSGFIQSQARSDIWCKQIEKQLKNLITNKKYGVMEHTKVEQNRSGTVAEELASKKEMCSNWKQQDLHIHAYLLRGFCAGGG